MIFRLFGLAVLLSLVLSQEPTVIEVNQPVSAQLDAGQYRQYTLIVANGESADRLFLRLQSVTTVGYGAPILAIFWNDRYEECPDCSFNKSTRLCMLALEDVKINTTLGISVKCLEKCKYSLNARISGDLDLSIGDSLPILLTESMITFDGKVLIPANLSFSELKFVALKDHNLESRKGVKIWANSGSNTKAPTEDSHSFSSMPIWNDGAELFISKALAQQNHTVRFRLLGEAGMLICLTCFTTTNNLRDIAIDQNIDDTVAQNTTKLYKLVVGQQLLLENSTLEVKVMKYAGQTKVLVFPEAGFSPDKVVPGRVTHFLNSIQVTPSIRKKLGFGNTFFISISGDRDSMFSLVCTVNNDLYTLLTDFSTELSEVDENNIDNYIYPLYLVDGRGSNIQSFIMSIEAASGNVEFGVRRCLSMQSDWQNKSCIINTTQEAHTLAKTFSEVNGKLSSHGAVTTFAFEYDIQKCARPMEGVIRCIFQIICFREQKATKAASYSFKFERGSRQILLPENLIYRDLADADQINFYWFPVTDASKVQDIKFILTLISGDCNLFISTDHRHSNLTDSQVQLVRQNQITFLQGNLSQHYFPAVKCYDDSFYTLLVAVSRTPVDTLQPHENVVPLTLLEGVHQSFTMGKQQTQQDFYFSLADAQEVKVHAAATKGSVKLQVYASEGFDSSKGAVWKGDQNGYARLSNSDNTYTKQNEFIVRVIGQPASAFELEFTTKKACHEQIVNQLMNVSFGVGQSQCYSFKITKLDPLEIVLSYNGWDTSLGAMNLSVSWEGGPKTQFSQRITLFSTDALKRTCPMLEHSDSRNQSQCSMQVEIGSSADIQAQLLVQYTSGEIELLDGLEQTVHGYLSLSQAKHFWWEVASTNQPILISLRSQSETRYSILASLIDQKKFYSVTGTQLYPRPEDPNTFTATTGHFMSTSLLIRASELENKTDQILLISVYSNLAVENACSFRIQLLQDSSSLSEHETKLGYLGLGDSRQYTVYADDSESLVVHINSYGISCYSLSVYDESGKPLVDKALQAEYVISPKAGSTVLLQLTGLDLCPFEIAYSKISRKLFELVLGRHFKFELGANDKIYFLYYHIGSEPFRVVPMTDYGSVQLRAKKLPNNILMSIDSYIANMNDVWDETNMATQSSLLVNSFANSACSECYFLIEASSESPASVSLLLHRLYSSVMIKPHRIIREVLGRTVHNVTYSLYERQSFNVTIQLFSGEISVQATHTQNIDFLVKQDFNGTGGQFQLVYKEKKSDKQLAIRQQPDNHAMFIEEAFLINIVCKSNCSFSLVAQSKTEYAHQTIEGLPKTVVVNSSSSPTCSQFLSLQKPQNTQFHIFVKNTSLLEYDIRLVDRVTWKSISNRQLFLVSQDKNDRQINIELKSLRGYYVICFKLVTEQQEPLSLSMMHSSQQRPIIATTQDQYLLSVPKPIIFEMYNPTNRSVAIEVFECRGKVQLQATTDYLSILRNSSEMAEHSKTAGHYVVQLHQATAIGSMFFAQVKPHPSKTPTDQISILYRYSTFHQHYFPYRSMGSADYSLRYHSSEGKVTISFEAIGATNNYYKIEAATYLLFIGQTQEHVKAALQCGLGSLFNKSQSLSIPDISTVEEIKFEVAVSEIADLLKSESSYVYVGVSCILQASEPDSVKNEFKFVYEQLQMTVGQVPISGKLHGIKAIGKLLVLWILIPTTIILLVLWQTLLYCCRWYEAFKRERFLLDSEDDQKNEPPEVLTQTVTMKNLVLPGQSMPRIDEV